MTMTISTRLYGATLIACLCAASSPAAASPEGTGAITGAVKLEGDAPAREPLSMGADPFCAKGDPQLSEAVVAEGGKLRDVHVRIRTGSIPGDHEPPDEPAQIDQEACMYRPRVIGVMPGQTLTIGNSDKTLHNVHGYQSGKSRFNLAQPPGGPKIERKVREGAEVIELRCDIHSWMRAYAVVSDHPFFDVTGEEGAYKLEGLPAGTYILEAWHPELGLERSEIEVRAGESTRHSFSFSAP